MRYGPHLDLTGVTRLVATLRTLSYAMQCAVCGEISPTDTEFTVSQHWVFAHGGRNPTHHTYREVITRPWKAWWKP